MHIAALHPVFLAFAYSDLHYEHLLMSERNIHREHEIVRNIFIGWFLQPVLSRRNGIVEMKNREKYETADYICSREVFCIQIYFYCILAPMFLKNKKQSLLSIRSHWRRWGSKNRVRMAFSQMNEWVNSKHVIKFTFNTSSVAKFRLVAWKVIYNLPLPLWPISFHCHISQSMSTHAHKFDNWWSQCGPNDWYLLSTSSTPLSPFAHAQR